MALQANLTLTGEKQTKIEGPETRAGRSGSIPIIACSHLITGGRDPLTGAATGHRVHKPLVITKELDVSSYALFAALCSGEKITSFKLDFYEPVAGGGERVKWTLELKDAYIYSIQASLPNIKIMANKDFREVEEVSFIYRTISWTWAEGGKMASDSWDVPTK